MHGEFENHDPIGLSAGVKIKPIAHQLVGSRFPQALLFLDGTSLVVFLDVHTPTWRGRATTGKG